MQTTFNSTEEAYTVGFREAVACQPNYHILEIVNAIEEWKSAQVNHSHTSFWGVEHIRCMRAYWLGHARGYRDNLDLLGACDAAFKHGTEIGKTIGSWVIDGNTKEETARWLLKGLDDGDPEVYDVLPANPLSGEWADYPSAESVLREAHCVYDLNDERADAVLARYEEGFDQGVQDEVTRAARAMLGLTA